MPIEKLRQLFCKHDWEYVGKVAQAGKASQTRDFIFKEVYHCRKCGKFKEITVAK